MIALPEFVTDGQCTVRLHRPRFVMIQIEDLDDPRLATPVAGCSFHDGRHFGIVEWIDHPDAAKQSDADTMARLARRAAEHGRLPS